jgi:DNA-binding PadR family transcriptional regulator
VFVFIQKTLFSYWQTIWSAKMELIPVLLMKRVYLGEFEEIVLLVVGMLDSEAYGVQITHEILQQTQRSARLNQVHASLQRLEEKGMVTSVMGDPTPERGGRRKRLFQVTAYGRQTLHDIQTVRTTLWRLLPASLKTLPSV